MHPTESPITGTDNDAIGRADGIGPPGVALSDDLDTS